MSERTGMVYKLRRQKLNEVYTFESISSDKLDNLTITMFEAFKDTVDYNGETLKELKKELQSVVESTFGIFIPEASFQIKHNGEVAAVILISFYNGNPFVSELFTNKNYLKRGMASALMKKSINILLDLGYHDLVLYVHPKNEGAINLYKKIGFVELD